MRLRRGLDNPMLHQPDIDKIDVQAVNTAARQQSQPLYAPRQKIHPKRAEGRFRRLKWIIMAVTLAVYYVTPWLRWDRGQYAPDQAVLIDIANRRFYFFFIEIWPQEFFFVAGLLVMAGVGLFLVTSVAGRAWCGYTCPQTVWTDLFLVVERFFEGDRNARIRLDKAPLSFDKVRKRVLKHATWLVIAVATGGAWIFYFADAPTLLRDFLTGSAPFVAYATVGILTATTYVLGGLMREQVCIYMCPWPRIQAAMLDEDSLVVTYNDWRGEPRTHGAKKAAAAGIPAGDCVDCNACVAVCPTGIDIREGQQLACITCALCIDACDGVMDKLGRERGLISYATLRDYDANMAIATDPATGAIDPARVRGPDGSFTASLKHFDWRVLLRTRTLVYTAVWAAIGIVLLTALLARDRLEVTVQHDRNPVAVTLSDGSIRNGYTVKLLNMIAEPRTITLRLEGLPNAAMQVSDIDQPAGTEFAVPVEPDRLRTLRVFVAQRPEAVQPGSTEFRFVVEDPASSESDSYTAIFDNPER
ncbi:cytochrome c oxidase accessory protein CcoG [Aurantimonas endophytica]|uniref:Cytochrome c oxidase accessory protein FixG n=1 Tax=Aurantimonas endophytica TaxID=1522175 RepID=A0A7W6MNI3_9HYPH|nr:cytochrome c oxidase accessory protein CcoG [Aurantimonas endophytica]MBB4001877.1 cytochrome c oxidase accessory protein FixG [Aurantimonas endophytica]